MCGCLLLTGGTVVAADGWGYRWRLVRVHGARIVILRAAGLDGTQVTVAPGAEAGGCGQIQGLHRLRVQLTVRHPAPVALLYLKGHVQVETSRTKPAGQTASAHPQARLARGETRPAL